MKIYFVDLENISVTALCTTQEIDAGDLVFIFYSDVCKKSAAKIKDNISENGIISGLQSASHSSNHTGFVTFISHSSLVSISTSLKNVNAPL